MADADPGLASHEWLQFFSALRQAVQEPRDLYTESIVDGKALTAANDTNVTLALSGTPATALLQNVTITAGWTGLLGLARGGTDADLSATGGAKNYLKQSSAGAAITVGTIPASDIVSGAALTKTDDTNVTLTLGGTPSSALLVAASLTLGWTGTLAPSRGGTGLGSYAIGDLLYASASTTLAKLADVAVGSYLRSGGVTTAPLWSTLTLPNAATSGDIFKASGTNAYASVAPGALSKTDDTNVTLTLGGSASTALVNAASLALGWTGTLAVSRGGIGVGTLASNGVLYGNGTSAVQALAVNASATKNFLTQTSSAAPAWGTIAAGDVPTLNQNTTGSAAKWTTPRLLAGNSVDGSANVAFANKVIVQGTTDAGLSAAQFLGALATGLVKNTTTTGVLSIAAAATDYVAPSAYASANGLTLATARLLGRTTAATGAAEEISVGAGLSLSAGSLSCTVTGGVGGSGTTGTLAKFTASTTLGNSLVSESGTTVTVAGVITATVFGQQTFSAGGTGGQLVFVENTTSGTANYARVEIKGGTTDCYLTANSQGFSGTATNPAAAFVIQATAGTGGICLVASDAAAVIRFIAGGASSTATTMSAAGSWSITGPLVVITNASAEFRATTGTITTTIQPQFIGTSSVHDQNILRGNATVAVFGAAGAVRFVGYGAGAATFDASGNITSVSDARYKDRVEPLPYGLAEILRLRPVQHGYTTASGYDTSRLYGGFLAQDVDAVLPLAVGVNGGGYLTLADRPIIGALVHAVQALHRRLEQPC